MRIVIVVGRVDSVDKTKQTVYAGWKATPLSGCGVDSCFINLACLWTESG